MYGYKYKILEIKKWPHLKNEPRNARISLAMDDVNPFGDLRTTYYVWPVLIIKTISSLGWQLKRGNQCQFSSCQVLERINSILS